MNTSLRNMIAIGVAFLLVSTGSVIAQSSKQKVWHTAQKQEHRRKGIDSASLPSAFADTPTATPSVERAGSPCTPTELFTDGTFEGGTPWPAWTVQTSTVFGTPLCSIAACGVGGGSANPFAGSNWVWFGGVPEAEMATLGRSVVIPSGGTASLTFQMRVGAVNVPFSDVLNIKVDGNIVQTYTEPAVSEAAYSLRTVNLNAFANGASHTLVFEYIHTDAGVANFTIDNVSLVADVCPQPVVSGRITYENAAVPIVPVPFTDLEGAGTPSVFAASNSQGNYALTGFGAGAYTVTPTKADAIFTAPNGIFSDDASLIARHVVGLTTLNATQLRAASVAGQPSVTSFDAGLVAQWIVGIPHALSQAGKWTFSPVSRTYPSIGSSQADQDYAALLIGDVNGDWSASAMGPQRAFERNAVLASLPLVMKGVHGTQITIPLRLDDLAGREVSSFQFDIAFDPRVIELAQLAANLRGTMSDGLTVVSNSSYPGWLKVVVYGATPVNGDGVYVDLMFLPIGEAGSSTHVMIKGFRFNNGTDLVTTAGGRLTVLKR